MGEFKFLMIVVIAIIASIVTWNISDFFISRREYYYKSSWGILVTKLGMCASIGCITFFILFKLLDNRPISSSKDNVTTNDVYNSNESDNNFYQNNSSKTQDETESSNRENDEGFSQDTLKKENEIEKDTLKSYERYQLEVDKATEMLKRNKSVGEIADSTMLSRQEIRQLKRKLRREGE